MGALLGNGRAIPDPTYHDLPPDLIIQDELHLISGPLGTMVGLYETAVDATRTGRRRARRSSPRPRRSAAPRIRCERCSTGRCASFRRPGLDPRDSFFAVEAPRDARRAGEYVGLMAPGASHATLMVRAYAALLQAAATDRGV